MKFSLEGYEQALQTCYTPVRPTIRVGDQGISTTPRKICTMNQAESSW